MLADLWAINKISLVLVSNSWIVDDEVEECVGNFLMGNFQIFDLLCIHLSNVHTIFKVALMFSI